MATTRIKDLSKTATTVNSDANLVLDGNTGGTQKISRDNFRQDTADAFVAAPGTYNLAPLNSGTGKIDAVYLSSSSDSPKGAWDASSNTPTLADGTGTAGDYYDVTVAGSSDLGSGSITFTVGDVVKYNGTVWFKIDSVANILDGVSTIDGAKSAIEIPDVGTAPNEVPLNGMLGDMAYQSSEGISVGTVEAEALEVTDKITTKDVGGVPKGQIELQDSAYTISGGVNLGDIRHDAPRHRWYSGATVLAQFDEGTTYFQNTNVGIGNSSPGSYHSSASDLVVGDTSGHRGITIVSGSGNSGSIYFADGTSGDALYRGYIGYNQGSNLLNFGTAASTQWQINGSGNLVAYAAGVGIDFGSTNTNTGVTVTGSVMSEYEQGTFTPKLADAASGGNEASIGTVGADYIRVGNQVFFAIRLLNINTTGLTSGNAIHITDMPYACKSNSSFVPFNVMADTLTFGGQLVGALQGGVSYATLREFSSGAGDSAVPVSAIGSTATDLFFTGSYFVD